MDRIKAAALLLLRRRSRRESRLWVHPINEKRKEYGDFYHLFSELLLDRDRFKRHFRMDADQMDHLLCMVGHSISKQRTNFREPIEAKQRLAITIR